MHYMIFRLLHRENYSKNYTVIIKVKIEKWLFSE